MSELKLGELLEKYPFVSDFFESTGFCIDSSLSLTFSEFLDNISQEELEDKAIDKKEIKNRLDTFIEQMLQFLGDKRENIESLTIFPGHNKSGEKEKFQKLDIFSSQIVSIVGATGSGKSRLLADIEWAAQNDTPTGRTIYINGRKPDPKWRYSTNNKLVAQLSQNMNFVMDLTAREFITMHAESRMIEDIETTVEKILKEANKLAGENFAPETAVTALSGGQSRALMIADTAVLSSSPIVLIDEIENAGIDRKKALDLLVSQDKIVLMATHDPLLALMADRRIVIKNGGIDKIIETTAEEKEVLVQLNSIDEIMQEARKRLRAGMTLEGELKEAKADIVGFRKGETIFNQGDTPRYITMLVEGSVSIGNDSVNGKRSIMGMFSNPGELFGEVFLFLNHNEYVNYAYASSPSKILEIPKEYLTRPGANPSALQSRMLSNMITIFAERTFYLNNRLQVLSCSTLRQKIARFILQNMNERDRVTLKMSREEFADFLNAARPSLSRELMKMQDDGFIKVVRKDLIVKTLEGLNSI